MVVTELLKQAEVQMRKGNYMNAIKYYGAAIDREEENIEAHIGLGIASHNIGDAKRAISSYKRSITINPKKAESYYYLGLVLSQYENGEKAIKSWKKCIENDENIAITYYYLCAEMVNQNKREEAKALIGNKICRTYPRVHSTLIEAFNLTTDAVEIEGVHMVDKLYNILVKELGKNKIRCFGDSHRSVFNNIENICCYNVGAGTAFNLISENSTTGAGNSIRKMISESNNKEDIILLAFGEIDCMEHVHKQHYKNDSNIKDIVERLCRNYSKFIESITDKGFVCLIYGPAFSGQALNSYGPLKERNNIVRLFNKRMKSILKHNQYAIHYCLDNLAVDRRGVPRFSLSRDRRHIDEFPHGSAEIQSIIMSGFLEEKLKKNKLKTIKEQTHEEEYTYTTIESIKGEARIKEQLKKGTRSYVIDLGTVDEWCMVVNPRNYIKIDEVGVKAVFQEYDRSINKEASIVEMNLEVIGENENTIYKRGIILTKDEVIRAKIEKGVARLIVIRIKRRKDKGYSVTEHYEIETGARRLMIDSILIRKSQSE